MKVPKVAIHISIQRIVQLVSLVLILWIAIYPVDSRLSCSFWATGPDVNKTCECFRALLNLLNVIIAPCIKGILTRNPGNFCSWNLEFWALEFKCSSRNPESHQRLESGSQVPLTKNSDSLPGIQNPWLEWNAESKTVLDSLKWGVKSQPRSQSS